MTDRERYLATLTFQKPDRVPFEPGWGRKSTREAWHRQGLPADQHNPTEYIRKLLGIYQPPAGEWVNPDIDFRMIPEFQEKVIQRRPAAAGSSGPGTLVVQDWKGNVCEISDEFDVTHLRNAIDFVTRSWIKCPVETHADWEEMKRRYNVDDPKRFPADWPDRARKLNQRVFYQGISVSGPFWQLREWLGFEGLCMLLLDEPDWAMEMVEFWKNFVLEMMARTFDRYVPEYFFVNEDMAYKEKPMIGPDMCRRFMVPCWKAWSELARSAGVKIFEVDSDGHVGQLIPVWLEAGFNVNSPLEVAAGNDLPAYRKLYGTMMAYRGGVDKRAMAKGGQAIRVEIDRLRPVINAGGYIPTCDHGIPSDVSWPNFVDYCRLLAEATGWL